MIGTEDFEQDSMHSNPDSVTLPKAWKAPFPLYTMDIIPALPLKGWELPAYSGATLEHDSRRAIVMCRWNELCCAQIWKGWNLCFILSFSGQARNKAPFIHSSIHTAWLAAHASRLSVHTLRAAEGTLGRSCLIPQRTAKGRTEVICTVSVWKLIGFLP